MMMQQKMTDKLFEEKTRTYIELQRRKLDVEIIKDNHENAQTQEILDKFTNLKEGMPGTNFKSEKFKELVKQRKEEIGKKREQDRLVKRYRRELARVKSPKERRLIEAKWQAL